MFHMSPTIVSCVLCLSVLDGQFPIVPAHSGPTLLFGADSLPYCLGSLIVFLSPLIQTYCSYCLDTLPTLKLGIV